LPSKELIEWQRKNFPDVKLESIEFTLKLIEEVKKILSETDE